jgi:hypothetical protein
MGGMDGRMYPGSLDWEKEKKKMGMRAHSTRNSGKASPGRPGFFLALVAWRSRHSATEVWIPSIRARRAITVHGMTAKMTTTT